MKEHLRRLISFICLLYPYKLYQQFIKKSNFIYTCWISNSLKNVGKGTRFNRPVYIRGGKCIEVGRDCILHSGVNIEAWEMLRGKAFQPTISIGDKCSLGAYTHVTACNRIVIGNNVLTGAFVIISDNNHGRFDIEDIAIPPLDRNLTTKGDVVIDDDVWLGDKVAILSGVHIGKGAIVAANAVVTHDVPPYSLSAGVPARVIKMLNFEKNDE